KRCAGFFARHRSMTSASAGDSSGSSNTSAPDLRLRQQPAVTELQRLNSVRETEYRREVERGRLCHRAEQHLHRWYFAALQHREQWHALRRCVLQRALEYRRLLRVHADV